MTEDAESMEQVARQVTIAYESGDLAGYNDLLDPNVRWGARGDPSPACQNRKQVLAWYQRGKEAGTSARATEVTVLGDQIVVGLVVSGSAGARERSGEAVRWQLLSVNHGLIVDIVGFEQRAEALAHIGAPE